MRLTFDYRKEYCEVNAKRYGLSFEEELKRYHSQIIYMPEHNVRKIQMWNKLGQLEDIEDELGIDLIILFKMIRDGFYIKTSDDILFFKNEDKYEMLKKYKDFTNDYGKTWALTKEELE